MATGIHYTKTEERPGTREWQIHVVLFGAVTIWVPVGFRLPPK